MNHSTNNAQLLNSSKPTFGFTTMNSMINETTTNTFNQDSQDTGYQTTSMANCGANGSASSSSSSCTQRSLINMDMTHASKIANQLNVFSSHNNRGFSLVTNQSSTNNILGSLIQNAKPNVASNVNGSSGPIQNPATTITSTPMSLGDDDFNFNFENVACSNFDTQNNYLDFYDEDLNNKKEKISFKSKKFDFSGVNVKAPNIDKKEHGANMTSLSFEFISKSNQNGVLFGQSLPSQSNKDELISNITNTNAYKRPLSFEKKKNNAIQANSNKSKKTSISLNSLQNIHPVGK
jgi:hypothetical protein